MPGMIEKAQEESFVGKPATAVAAMIPSKNDKLMSTMVIAHVLHSTSHFGRDILWNCWRIA
jgi:hypothetical protein